MATLGFRIDEVIRLNVAGIDFKARELKLRSEKSRRRDSLIILAQLFKETIDYIRLNQEAIDKAGSYRFIRDAKAWSSREEPYVEQNYVRKVFMRYVELAGLDDIYDISRNPALLGRRGSCTY